MSEEDDLVILLDDDVDSDSEAGKVSGRWKIVVVDDDPAVHDGTRFALSDYRLNDMGLEILSAYSAAQGRSLLAEHPDAAVVLLDVVMETETAGLELVGYIRERLRNETVRIILRTGQPGQAPERRVIVDFDINDYKAKTELTADKLFTTLTTALRSYVQLKRMDETQRGLEVVVEAASTLYDFHSVERLAEAMLGGLATVVGGSCDGVVVFGGSNSGTRSASVIAGIGCHAGVDRPRALDELDCDMQELVALALTDRGLAVRESGAAMRIATRSGREIVIALQAGRLLTATDEFLIEVFRSRLPAAFDNVALYVELQEANALLEVRVAQRTEELDRANAFKKEVLGIVAHDLKNPLSVILGRADMLAQQVIRDPLPIDSVRKQVDQITQSARRMTAMIEGLIAGAMNDALEITVRRFPVNVARLVQSVAEANLPLAERKSQTIAVEVPAQIRVRADYDRLREAVDNLVSNAIKYSPPGGAIALSAIVEDDRAVIRVSDNGPGLTEEDMNRLFGRFQRLSARPTGGESSSGLGLSIAKRIVELHEGRIWAQGAGEAGGATFCISLPLNRDLPGRGAQNGSPT